MGILSDILHQWTIVSTMNRVNRQSLKKRMNGFCYLGSVNQKKIKDPLVVLFCI
ncbi:hypothetical protein KP78_39240 [Jeotgalibacillus soli]|uniref:Uncharacterized protein n=1 Tax=Jeotgalibacillus soli TaxID=889306 RepID=A0A0C2VDQ9_9BACL|nr:hypothetical protein KP78_39240 [Jeotgalibacillus soli]